MSDLRKEIEKRRTFAIISHPDAGKTTLTEKFLLYGGAINLAGSVKGKATARHAVSDWMEIEKQRGISVTSSVLQLLEKNGFIVRESEKKDARLKRIIPTKKAEALRPSILAHIRQAETQLTTDISEADVLTCKKVLYQMLYNVSEHKEVCKKNE